MVDKQNIKQIIGERQEELLSIQIVERPMKFDRSSNYVLIGPRRAGKSYMLYWYIQQLAKNKEVSIRQILYINFEDERIALIQAHELGTLLEAYQEMYPAEKPWIFLDEIQNITDWEKFARRLADSKYHVMITGSNAKMLSSEIATTLGGRYIAREVFPFSFAEYLTYCGLTLQPNWEYMPAQRQQVKNNITSYLQYGGFAETFDKTDKREWLNSLYQKIIMGDIVERNAIRNPRVFRLLARKLADSVMQPMSIARLQHLIVSTGEKISLPILKDYLSYMSEAYLTFDIPNLASHFSEQATALKRYFIDNGILNLFSHNDVSKLLENIVAIQLHKKYDNNSEYRLFYYNRGIEIDFCIPDESLAIQVSYNIDDIATAERETGALQKFMKLYPEYKGIIITYDQEKEIEINGLVINVIPLWKWLVQQQ